ncbi:amino acid adenylation domain-containing protein [Tenacibaculum tangerinum]|uniref:Amino acid adenylation domain-containing protein n=1 Tax=Tenacibaculum tangerinum TaxID=3038772 RepID=A0ABY8KYB6_9FLAO|nr:amino acid adenylation domain-containing protein [Tenacibaculum tangerinum]WGH74229.1 amino acid adenylation domain-containing protein [Tenacibaculum tangerinum]
MENNNILSIIEEAFRVHANKVAIIQGDQKVLYSELDERSNQLANMLIESGVQKGDIVGILMERSIEMMTTIFAITKVGTAYLPLDPSYPKERLRSIFEDSKIKTLVSSTKDIYDAFEGKQFSLEEIDLSIFSKKSPEISVSGNDLAYVIYTSGSTGKPKGVAIEHGGLYNRLIWKQKAYPITSSDTLFFKTVYTFDVSVWEIFWWSMYGASVVLLPSGREQDVRLMFKLIDKHQINVIHFVPSVFRLFLEYLSIKEDASAVASLKYVFTSGEKLAISSVNTFNQFFKNLQGILINLYGPTEASIDVSHYAFREKEQDYTIAPIGKAISNIKLWILDNDLKDKNNGEEGELYISGIGLARNYVNNEELTNLKFVSLPNHGNIRAYKTGDIVYRDVTSLDICFVGRKDFQVKLRGLRVELADIEKQLKTIENIQETVVLMNEKNGNQFLYAFYKSNAALRENFIKEQLKTKLPIYMIPNKFVFKEQFPLLSSGKLDRKKLIDEL